MHAQPFNVPATMRAVRGVRRVSQRQLAELAGVPRTTVERIEAGSTDPHVATLSKLLVSIGVELHACIGKRPLQLDPLRERLVDAQDRHLPPHWQISKVQPLDSWYGWWRKHPDVVTFPPEYTYWKPFGRSGELDDRQLAHRWADAT